MKKKYLAFLLLLAVLGSLLAGCSAKSAPAQSDANFAPQAPESGGSLNMDYKNEMAFDESTDWDLPAEEPARSEERRVGKEGRSRGAGWR